jgi:hypothetical protein
LKVKSVFTVLEARMDREIFGVERECNVRAEQQEGNQDREFRGELRSHAMSLLTNN